MSADLKIGTLPDGSRVAQLTLAAPRANALVPALLDAVAAALDRAEGADCAAILVAGGRNFSIGGDVRAFREALRAGEGRAYAAQLVPQLQDLVERLVTMPRLVAIAARGAVTGGAAGFLFAADLAVVSPDCFVQPYYAQVGFAPDGGWTALLPERIGAGPAQEWLLHDRRVGGAGLVALRLAATCDAAPEAAALRLLGQGSLGARLAAKALIWDAARRALLRSRLDAEVQAFLDRIERPETRAGMDAFLARNKGPADV
jgi:2-(1,2-epoxy-1,2-dihydrophenyl)acetyl-CoA isomerase